MTLLNETQAAEFLAVSVRTVQGWRVRGGGPQFVKIGRGRGAIRYSAAALEEYVAARVRKSTSDQGVAE